MNAKPTSFDDTGSVIALTQWIEKIEYIFEICSCSEANKGKFAACTFANRALTWWNGRVKSLTLPVSNAMGWESLKEILLVEYCPRVELQKLEHELWNLKMKGSVVAAYTSRFEDLALLYPGMPTKGNVLAAKPNTFDSAKCLAQTLIDHGDSLGEVATAPEPEKRSAEKRKFWKQKKVQSSQEPSKKQQTVAVQATTTPIATAATQAPTSRYAGTFPRCDKCNYHHLTSSPYREMLYNNYGKKGHTARNCKSPAKSYSVTVTHFRL
ncbi:hypothetical protein Lser_V15G44813 [Lactuca serriola]